MQNSVAKVSTGNSDRLRVMVPLRAIAFGLVCMTAGTLSHVSLGDDEGDAGSASGRSAVPFTVGAREGELYYYPCADCHDYMDPVSNIRTLDVETGHPSILEHGDGLMWCFSCHDQTEYGVLRNLLAEPVDFDNGYKICRGCHSQKYLDWTHGAHGKRAANWTGERRLYSCVECHNPHRPSISPRAPKQPPPVRSGLEPMKRDEVDHVRDERRKEWEQTHAR